MLGGDVCAEVVFPIMHNMPVSLYQPLLWNRRKATGIADPSLIVLFSATTAVGK